MTTPEVQILYKFGSDLSSFIPNVVATHNSSVQRHNAFSLVETNVNNSLTFHGTGFKYAGTTPTGGHVTSITMALGGDSYARIENLSFSLTKLFNIVSGDHPEKLFDLFGDTGFTGNAGEDVITTGRGVDRLNGGGADDTLIGGAGGDDLNGGKGIDTASYTNASRGVIASLISPELNTHDAEGDTYSSIENLIGSAHDDNLAGDKQNNVLDGGRGDDVLSGFEGVNKLYGGSGDDRLITGKSSDIMYGGTGADAFWYFRSAIGNSEPDRIQDWDGHDSIWVDAGSFGHGLVAGQALTNAQFHLDAPVGTNGQFVYSTSGGNLVWYANGVDSAATPILVEIVGAPDIDRHDITVFALG